MNRLQRRIRQIRPFDFYAVLRPENPWWLPALRVVGHSNALVSFYGLTPANTSLLKDFLDDPVAMLANNPRHASKHEILVTMKQRYVHMMMCLQSRARTFA